MNLTDALARAYHAHRCDQRAAMGKHAPYPHPCGRCDSSLVPFDALTDAQQDDLRREVAWAVEAVGPMLAELLRWAAHMATVPCLLELAGDNDIAGCECGSCFARATLARLAKLGVTP